MRSLVQAEENCRRYIEELVLKKSTVVGLILGQTCEQRDTIVHLVRTPVPDDDPQVEASHNEASSQSSPKTKIQLSKIEDYDSYVVAQHAKQVTRMLLGGFDVLGVFACTQSDSLSTSNVAALKKMIYDINKELIKCNLHTKHVKTERLMMHISLSPHKISCKTVDISDSLASPKPADIKFLSTPTKWLLLQCQLAVDLTIPLAKESSKHDLFEQMQIGLRPFCEAIKCATAVVDGDLRSGSELLGGSDANMSKGKRGKHKEVVPVVQPTYTVDFFIGLNSIAGDRDSAAVTQQCCASMQVRGTIGGRAYVQNKATVAEGIENLKLDVLRSLTSRCAIHCEDLLVIDEEQEDRIVIHELPFRIFAPLPGTGITISEYLFPGETTKDSLQALDELLDLQLREEDVEANCERLPETADLTPASEEKGTSGVPVREILPPKPPKSCNYIFLGLSVAVAIMAGGTSYYVFQN